MKNLPQILESILDPNYDITDDDINPLREFVTKYKSNTTRKGAHYIRNKWDHKELRSILMNYGHDVGSVLYIDFDDEVESAHKSKETIVLVDTDYSEFHIFVPSGSKWKLYTCDLSFSGSTLFKASEYTNNELFDEYWVFQKEHMYVLKDDQFLKDLQKYLA